MFTILPVAARLLMNAACKGGAMVAVVQDEKLNA